MKMQLGMGCKGCRGLRNVKECTCITARQEDIEELSKEILQFQSLREKVRVLEDIVSVLEEMTNTDITIEIEDKE